jgi:LacI family transcriptional regulator
MSSTIKDVANYTGYSISTISKYINGGNVRPKNRKVIEEAIRELDFKPNAIARGLKNSRTRTVGLLVPALSNLFSTTIITAVERILQENGYGVIICDCNENRGAEFDKTRFLLEKMVDGIITTPYNSEGNHLDPIKAANLPLVLIDNTVDKYIFDAVLVDNMIATYNAVNYLISMGHQDIGIICGDQDIFTTNERLGGYLKALKSNNLQPQDEYIRYGNYKLDSGFVEMTNLWNLEKRPTAVFITNYEMTIGAIVAINSLGINCPDDLSVIGFDNIHLAAIKPQLTVVSQPMEQIGETAARLLLKRMNGQYEDYPSIIRLNTTLDIKDSVKRIR